MHSAPALRRKTGHVVFKALNVHSDILDFCFKTTFYGVGLMIQMVVNDSRGYLGEFGVI